MKRIVRLSDTSFHRPIGDVGNPGSYSCPVIFHVARGVTAAEMVQPVPRDAFEPAQRNRVASPRRGTLHDILALESKDAGDAFLGVVATCDGRTVGELAREHAGDR